MNLSQKIKLYKKVKLMGRFEMDKIVQQFMSGWKDAQKKNQLKWKFGNDWLSFCEINYYANFIHFLKSVWMLQYFV